MGNFQEVFLIMLSFFANLKLMTALYSWNIFCLERHNLRHLKIARRQRTLWLWLLLQFTLFFIRYFINSWKLLLEIVSPPEKIHSSLYTHTPHKNSKSASPSLFGNIENFSGPPCSKGRGGGEETMQSSNHLHAHSLQSLRQPTKMYHRYSWHTKNTFLYLFLWSIICWNQIEEILYSHFWVCEQFCCKILVPNGGLSLFLSIFKTTNIGRLTFLLPFSRYEIYKKSTKNKGFQCAVTQVLLVKNSWNKK